MLFPCYHIQHKRFRIDYPLCPDSPSEFEDFVAARSGRDNVVVGKMNALISKLTDPSFCVTMRPTHVRKRCRLNVPLGFSRKYLKNQHGNVIFESMNGATYPAKYTHFRKTGRKATRQFSQTCIEIGWKMFVRDNRLAVGDVCFFELIDASENILRVAIVRGSKDGKSCGRKE